MTFLDDERRTHTDDVADLAGTATVEKHTFVERFPDYPVRYIVREVERRESCAFLDDLYRL